LTPPDCLHSHGQEFGPPKTAPEKHGNHGAVGWHICFDVLDHLLSGTPIGRIVAGEAMKFGWHRLNAEYAKQFGIETPNWPSKAAQKS
jgi:hypothetical protein